jgi:hypothetical protein
VAAWEAGNRPDYRMIARQSTALLLRRAAGRGERSLRVESMAVAIATGVKPHQQRSAHGVVSLFPQRDTGLRLIGVPLVEMPGHGS